MFSRDSRNIETELGYRYLLFGAGRPMGTHKKRRVVMCSTTQFAPASMNAFARGPTIKKMGPERQVKHSRSTGNRNLRQPDRFRVGLGEGGE